MREETTVSALLNVYHGHIVVIGSDEKTLFNSLISPDYSPDILCRVIIAARSAGSVLVVTVKD